MGLKLLKTVQTITTFRNPLADPVGTRRGPPLFRGPQFENRCCTQLLRQRKRRRSKMPYVITLCTSGFMDDVIFAQKPRLVDVAAQLKRSAHAALGLAMNCAQ